MENQQPNKGKQLKKKQRKQVVFRVNFLFFTVFLLFSTLILRLGYLQIVKGEDFVAELARVDEITINTTMPRGRIYDRIGHVLVDNEPQNAITYTKTTQTKARATYDKEGNQTSEDGMLEIAEKLAAYIEKDDRRVTVADKRDFWILLNPELAAEKVPKEERKEISSDKKKTSKQIDREINQLTRDRITEEELNSFTQEELKVLAIYREMMAGYAYSPSIVKSEDVSEEEFAIVSEHLSDLPGVNTTTDWKRVKLSKSAILGSTTSPIEGIPKSHLDYYLSRGYSRNDRVGRSYLEQQYEDLLSGQKAVHKNIKNRAGKVVGTEVVYEGEPGKDLVLSVDRELELELEQMLEKTLRDLKQSSTASKLDQGFIVMMDPNNGEVLALVGKQIVRNEETGKWDVLDYAYGTFTAAYEAGSTVKLATMLTGYNEGVVRLGERKIDEPLRVGGIWKRSLFNRFGRVSIDDVTALGRSSNVYMFKIALSLGQYVPGRASSIDTTAYDKFRDNFASFGLGVRTGIDLPGEVEGVKGPELTVGKLMDFSIGQYDTYTTLQMAQYVSTIANGGYRIAPRVVKEIREPSVDGIQFGPLLQETPINVLNRIENTAEEIEQVKKGMHYVYYGPNGTAARLMEGASYTAAGKTGTAETFKDGRSTISLSHVGYAPAENPEVAYAVVIPHVTTHYTFQTSATTNNLVRSALDSYFAIKERRAQEGTESEIERLILPPIEQLEEKN